MQTLTSSAHRPFSPGPPFLGVLYVPNGSCIVVDEMLVAELQHHAVHLAADTPIEDWKPETAIETRLSEGLDLVDQVGKVVRRMIAVDTVLALQEELYYHRSRNEAIEEDYLSTRITGLEAEARR